MHHGADPQHAESQHAGSQHAESQRADPQHADSQHVHFQNVYPIKVPTLQIVNVIKFQPSFRMFILVINIPLGTVCQD
jgi:hypothetical protein